MRTLKLILAYDGTNYAGWQMQRRHDTPTIQGTLQRALYQILHEPVAVVGSGRTDAGVHATAQTAHVKIRSAISCRRLHRALNGVLPPDIVVTDVAEAPAQFHARFDAKMKRYRYRIVHGAFVSPFERRYVHQVRAPLNVALMRREAAALLGRHDMRAFQKAGRPMRRTRRTISDLRIRRRKTDLSIEIEANGFLHTMVRSIVGTLIDVGRGHRPPGTIATLLRTKNRRLVGPTAPAKGLCLLQVRYSLRKETLDNCHNYL